MASEQTNQFFAPEVLQSNLGQGVDWAKADIYSLAKTCLFILSGEIVEDTSELLNVDDINEHIKSTLLRMLSKNPMDRPEIEELFQIIK